MSRPNLIAASLAAAPPDMSVAEWSRTSFEGRLLVLFRDLPPERQQAFLQAGRRMADGMPVRQAALLAYQECGMNEAEVAEAMAGLPVPAEEA